MPKGFRLKTAGWVAVASLVFAAGLFIWWTFRSRPGPTMFCSAMDPTTGMATVELTNATARDWSFRLYVAQGQPTPCYFITPEKEGLPGWGVALEEGIYCSGFLYRRDSSGRYIAPEVVGSWPSLTAKLTNIVLRPQQALSFHVPVGEIHGLSKVGATYQLPLASTRSGRAKARVLPWLRRILHITPGTPYQGWCETKLPTPPDEH